MKETFFFPHDYNARNDRKLVKLACMHGMAGIGIYWCIVEKLYEEAGFLPLDLEGIAYELRTDFKLVKSVIHDFELFQIDEEKFWSETAISRLKLRMEKSEKARASVLERWDKYKRNTDVVRPNNERYTRKGKTSTVKERKGKNSTVKERKGKKKKAEDMRALPETNSYQTFLDTFHSHCSSLPRVTKLTDQRLSHLRARISDHGEETVRDVFRIAGQSKFLSGDNQNRWQASFDWIIAPTNFMKILEGNYNNKEHNEGNGQFVEDPYGFEAQDMR